MRGEVTGERAARRRPKRRRRRSGGEGTPDAASLSVAELEALRMRRVNPAQYYRDNLGQLGFGDLEHATVQTVKELVDNALDACEVMKVAPDIRIHVVATSRSYEVTSKSGETKPYSIYRVQVEDNGCGVVRQKLAKCFGTVLYGSKFFSMKQSRGQQGIGAHAAIIYSQMTTLEPARITSKTEKDDLALQLELKIDCDNNRPIVASEEFVEYTGPHGTAVRLLIPGKYSGRLTDYAKQLSLANPHANIWMRIKPSPTESQTTVHLPRTVQTLPPDPKEIKPHILSMEPGILHEMIVQDKCCHTQRRFLSRHFCRISMPKARQMAKKVSGNAEAPLKDLDPEKALKAAKSLHLLNPPLDVLSPIGETNLRASLRGLYPDAEFIAVVNRAPWSYRGVPFQIEVAVAYGGSSVTNDCTFSREGAPKPKIVRIANRCPLPYDSKDCVLYKAARDIDWRIYKLPQTESGLPAAPMVVVVSLTSSRVPYIGPGKYGVAFHEEIYSEGKLALQTLGRHLRDHIQRKEKQASESRRLSVFKLYASETARDISIVTGKRRGEVEAVLLSSLHRRVEPEEAHVSERAPAAPTEKPILVEASGGIDLKRPGVQRSVTHQTQPARGPPLTAKKVAAKDEHGEQFTLDSYLGVG